MTPTQKWPKTSLVPRRSRLGQSWTLPWAVTSPRDTFSDFARTTGQERTARDYADLKQQLSSWHSSFRRLTAVEVADSTVRSLSSDVSSWAAHVNRKWAFFSFNIAWRYQICFAKWLYSYRDDLATNLFKIWPKGLKTPLPVDVISWKHRCLNSPVNPVENGCL